MPDKPVRLPGWAPWLLVGGVALACGVWSDAWPWIGSYPGEWTLPIARWIGEVTEAGAQIVRPLSRSIAFILEQPMVAIRDVLQWTPWPATIALATGIAWLSRAGIAVAVLTVASLTYVLLSGYWVQTMNTLALVAVAVPLSVLLGLAAGIAAHYSRPARAAVLPLLDFMQTMPTFAYLIPILFLFGFGPVVGLIASAIFAAPPMVRNVMLGLGRVSPEVVEAGHIAGTSRRQQLMWVELPAALPQLMIGLNQTIMAALSMVIIAAVIGGFDDIGWEVLASMRKARFGDSLLAGLVIVLIAVMLDRVSAAFATTDRTHRRRSRSIRTLGIVVVALVAAGKLFGWQAPSDVTWIGHLAAGIDANLTAFVGEFGDALAAIKNQSFYFYLLPVRIGFGQAILPFTWGFALTPEMKWGYALASAALSGLLIWRVSWQTGVATALTLYLLYFGLVGSPWPVLSLGAVVIAHAAAGWRGAAFVACVCTLILVTGLWEKAMLSVYLCGSAALLAFVIGAALGVGAALSDGFARALRPVLDTFQTIPLFVFLIPVLMLFQIGEFTALLAIIAYAFVPAARYTENGLRQVPGHLVEVARMQGCSQSQIFWQVKVPIAMPVIVLGLNQTVLFAFAMLVIAALVGTTGLGQQVYLALSAADVGAGLVAGSAMALLAMAADRVLRGWAHAARAASGSA
ncbi:MAG: ABC transporter permease [Gammaproteobacteria bacterium]